MTVRERYPYLVPLIQRCLFYFFGYFSLSIIFDFYVWQSVHSVDEAAIGRRIISALIGSTLVVVTQPIFNPLYWSLKTPGKMIDPRELFAKKAA